MNKFLIICLTVFTIITKAQTPKQISALPSILGESACPTYYFFPNGGQIVNEDLTDNKCDFYTNFGGVKNFIFKDGKMSYVFYKADTIVALADTADRIDQELIGANILGSFTPINETSTGLNYYIGGIGAFSNVVGKKQILGQDYYPNIDVEYSSNSYGVKQSFIINANGHPNDIILKFTGAQSTSINPDGSLTLQGHLGSITYRQPTAYLFDNNNIISYLNLQPTWLGTANPNEFQFTINTYNINKRLIISIDQGKDEFAIGAINSLEWSTYFGGASNDETKQVKTNAANNLYTCGYSQSTNYPTTPGTSLYQSQGDVVYSKFDNTGALQFSTYFGSTGVEKANSLEVRPNGDVYVAGQVWSPNFITLSKLGSYFQQTIGGPTINRGQSGYDGFITQFSSNGTPIWSTYYGSVFDDYINKIKFDANGNLFVIGWTTSTSLPGLTNSGSHYFQLCNNSTNPMATNSTYDTYNEDAFIVKFNANTSALSWGSCVGGLFGNGTSFPNDNFVDLDFNAAGDVYVTGYCFANSYP